ncbi:PBS lyase HEAT-like repeat protein [bacterium BMS3Abin07]|nr:PBS lyase HEAT-like repeat protein [bacterium BMS3Abin07]GBE31790.1 PBS lyase HEAT-like repeat protein [bacterium BMS3Bbin05]HDO23384.1 HEAT repeat domain-containing protein [Nitrospirota bacterium]HDZ87430.1 HEAT repeat domain-containing protein [Nitrospirota bacterium]
MDAESTKISKNIVQNIIKSKKNLRMYPENNPVYIKTVDAAYNAFTEFLDYYGELIFRIKQLEIIHDGEQVYYNPGKDDNLALFFFKDGIREIVFRKGLSKQELEDFFRIIMQDFDKEVIDDDVVTLMWERDFQNISYIVDETFLSDEDDYEETAARQVKEQAAGEDDILKAYSEVSDEEDITYVPVVPLNETDIAKLREELDKDTGYFIHKLIYLLFEMLYLCEKKNDLVDVVSFFRSAIDYAIQNNHIEMAVEILKKVDELMHSSASPEALRPHLRLVSSYINSERVIKFLGELLDSRAASDEEFTSELCSYMDKSAIPALIKILGELETIHARKVIINDLAIIGRKDVAAVAKGLNDRRWYVVRNIIYVLRNIKDKRAVEYLTKKLRHNDIRVRKEVIKALGDLGGAEVVNNLRIYLEDTESSVRRITARSLAETMSPYAKKILIEEMSSSAFKSKDFNEKKEFFESVSVWNDSDVIKFLIKTIKKKPFLRRARINENRACAAYALGLIGGNEAREVLEKFANTRNALIREYANTAIKRIDYGASGKRA